MPRLMSYIDLQIMRFQTVVAVRVVKIKVGMNMHFLYYLRLYQFISAVNICRVYANNMSCLHLEKTLLSLSGLLRCTQRQQCHKM